MRAISVGVFGEALIDLIQQPSGEYLPFVGGSPFNVARSFARQGLNTSYLSPISNDEMGGQIYKMACNESIKIPNGNRSPKVTSLALVYKDSNGQPDYQLYREGVADLDVTTEDLLENVPNDVELFHTGSLALVPKMLPILSPVIKTLKARGVLISIDINIRKGVELNHASYIDAVKQIVALADIVKVSDEDLELMGLNQAPEMHALELQRSTTNGIVILTMGSGGVRLLAEELDIQKAVFLLVPLAILLVLAILFSPQCCRKC